MCKNKQTTEVVVLPPAGHTHKYLDFKAFIPVDFFVHT